MHPRITPCGVFIYRTKAKTKAFEVHRAIARAIISIARYFHDSHHTRLKDYESFTLERLDGMDGRARRAGMAWDEEEDDDDDDA